MTVLLATTTVTIEAPVEDEPGDGRQWVPIGQHIQAQIGNPGGSEQTSPGGGQQQLSTRLICDPVDGFDHTCRVTDEHTNEVWEVSWVKVAYGLIPAATAALIAWTGGGR